MRIRGVTSITRWSSLPRTRYSPLTLMCELQASRPPLVPLPSTPSSSRKASRPMRSFNRSERSNLSQSDSLRNSLLAGSSKGLNAVTRQV